MQGLPRNRGKSLLFNAANFLSFRADQLRQVLPKPAAGVRQLRRSSALLIQRGPRK